MIILTGASGGIGKELLSYLVKVDHVLGIYNSTQPSLAPTADLDFERVNLEDPAEIEAFVGKWKAKLSNLTLIHCAALKIDGLTANYSLSDWDRVMNVNLRANYLLTQALIPRMIQDRWGRIIHLSSKGGIEGDPGTVAYSTSKAGLIGMSRVLAKEYARLKITSNVLLLGHFEAGLFEKLPDGIKETLLNQIPSRTLGKVSDIGNAIEFLIRSEFVNGATINIDGGM
jgi:3-oxoacyl-[acyl-carrier protein] reductase